MIEAAGLAGLFGSSFLSATLLPGHSELALLAFLFYAPTLAWPAVGISTLGNTLGGMSSYLIGRFFAHRITWPARTPDGVPTMLRRYGIWALLLSWVPVVGDALCVASGALRQTWWQAAAILALGKGARYVAVAWFFLA